MHHLHLHVSANDAVIRYWFCKWGFYLIRFNSSCCSCTVHPIVSSLALQILTRSYPLFVKFLIISILF